MADNTGVLLVDLDTVACTYEAEGLSWPQVSGAVGRLLPDGLFNHLVAVPSHGLDDLFVSENREGEIDRLRFLFDNGQEHWACFDPEVTNMSALRDMTTGQLLPFYEGSFSFFLDHDKTLGLTVDVGAVIYQFQWREPSTAVLPLVEDSKGAAWLAS